MTVIAPPACTSRRTTLEIADQRTLARMAVKLYLLGSLAWDYADTCIDLAAAMRLSATKKLCRAIRELKRDYDRFRNSSLRDKDLVKETELGLLFESICQEHFSRLNYGLASDKITAGLKAEYAMLVKAVQMAMTVLDAMSLYAAECDEWLVSQGVGGHSILADHFRRLAVLLPEFAGDHYNAAPEARRLTARILLYEIKRIDIYDDNGKV